jgi:hypothetical protein
MESWNKSRSENIRKILFELISFSHHNLILLLLIIHIDSALIFFNCCQHSDEASNNNGRSDEAPEENSTSQTGLRYIFPATISYLHELQYLR